MSDSGSIEETIFIGARQLSRPEERAAYLKQACGDDRALRERVERMLNAEQKADQFLADNPLQVDKTALVTIDGSEAVGSMIGRYKLLQQIGEGGCGVVYMAEQEQPIRRRVALKVIKPGMDTRQVIARFEAERQAVSMMDHPNIARVLDAGATDAGRPYFVMELVRGIRITEYCDQNNLSTRERLDLFVKVVQAVQHAHQKGIIHRDLKPSNVLITLHDGVPVPKVIDFGIAKALEQKLTDKTLFTQFEQFIGTPAYTSPEQAEMSGLDIDTRSDIYSLGVLLYELLVGETPFDQKELLRSGLDEMRRIIREKEPDRPSTRLSTMLAAERTSTAQHRSASSPELMHLLKGDLDWIVLKCLEKDRTRRYDTANGLAGDIQHYLSNEPVTARPPSQVYKFGKLVRRNKLAFAAGTAVVVALVSGIIASTWQAARARHAEQVAKEEKDSAEAVLNFFRNKVLAAGRPEGQAGGLGKDVTLREAIDAAEAEIGKSFSNRPLVEASIRKTLGDSYGYLGEPALAGPQLARAFMLRRQSLGLDHDSTLSALDGYRGSVGAATTVAYYEEALRLRKTKLGSHHPATIDSMHDLAIVYSELGKLDQALALNEEVSKLRKVKLGSNNRQTLNSMNNVGVTYLRLGKLDQALEIHKETLALRQAALGPDHPDTISSLLNLHAIYGKQKKSDQTVSAYEEVVRIQRTIHGPDHPETLVSMDELALTYANAGKLDQAIPIWEEVINLQKAKLGSAHPDTLVTMFRLADWYWKAGRRDESVRLDEETLRLRKAKLGPTHSSTLESMFNLAFSYRKLGRLDEAEALYREYMKHKSNSPTARFQLASILLERAKTNTAPGTRERQEVDELLRDYLAGTRARYTNLEESLYNVADLRFRHRQYAEAEPLYREWLKNLRDRVGAEHKDVIGPTASLGRLLADWAWAERDAKSEVRNQKAEIAGRAREAERLLRECLAAHLNGTNQTPWRVGDVRSRLGAALLSRTVTDPTLDRAGREARLVEAETLLLEGQQRIQGRRGDDRKYERDGLERLVRLYEAWDKPAKRAEWQQQLEAFDREKSKSMASLDEGP